MKKRSLRILCMAGLYLTALIPSFAENAPVQPVKYVILMIGDGMGPAQRHAAELYLRAKTRSDTARLWMNTLPVKGMTTTHSANSPITGSAAAGTALACGRKTKNGVIGMNADCTMPLESIAEIAKKQGRKVGIISSVPIDHATPASFYAHQPSRRKYYEIATTIPASGFDYFAGLPFYGTGQAKGRPLPEDLIKQAGYRVVRTKAEFEALTIDSGKTVVLANVPYRINEKTGELNLKDLTEKGLQLLDNPAGFFLMIEGGKIDWAGHANDMATNVREVLAFDDAVASVLKFCNDHKGETLLVVTADHETGGLQTNITGRFDPESFCHFIEQQKISGGQFNKVVETWKKNPPSFEDALQIIKENFGLADLTDAETETIKPAFEAVISGNTGKKISPELARMYGNGNPVVLACQNIVSKRCGVVWTSFGHTGVTVPTTATGPNAELFGGQTDNTDISRHLRSILLTEE